MLIQADNASMLYTKPITEITFQDILDFCALGLKENINLDYKEEVDSSLAKTISAMANTWGGIVLIGVKDDDSTPQQPIVGIPFREHILEQINNIILGNTTPPVFPEIQICPSPDSSHVLIVVRVAQSNTSPHAIRGNTKVYIRTNTSNEPEEQATVDRVLWLIDRRKKSCDLKETLSINANTHFEKVCQKEGCRIESGDLTMSIVPLHPFEALVDYRELTDVNDIRELGYESYMPKNLHKAKTYSLRDGSYSLQHYQSGYICYEEFNQYGFFYHRETLAGARFGSNEKTLYLKDIMCTFDLFLGMAGKWYSKLGYWGMVEFKLSLAKINDVKIIDLPAPKGYGRIEREGNAIDEQIEFIRELSVAQLLKNRSEMVSEILSELCWATGLGHNTSASIKVLIKEEGR